MSILLFFFLLGVFSDNLGYKLSLFQPYFTYFLCALPLNSQLPKGDHLHTKCIRCWV